jgi:hypothetical protein
MPIVYSNAVKTARAQAVIDALGPAGVIAIMSAANADLALVPLSNPAFTQVNGTMTMKDAPRTVNAIGAANAAKAELRHSSGTVVMSGLTVGTAGSGPGGSNPDVIINAVSITVGQSVQATVGTITPTS